MLLEWLKNRRRKALRQAGLPQALTDALPGCLWQYDALDAPLQDRIREDVAVLLAEKNWEGCGGLEMTEYIKLTIAAQVALVTLGFERQYFDSVLSILVYPDAFQQPDQQTRSGIVLERGSPRIGEAWHRGPVILSWSDVSESAAGPNQGRFLVAHEFAHQLDMLNNGDADGVPPMESDQQAKRWITVLNEAWRRLRRDCRTGSDPLVDSYGATNRSEFFAVVSEAFFQTPQRIAWQEHELYEAFKEYYRLDPMTWAAG
ncbi:MAG: zinc-dependent peptidase [Planctomycetales bacterium]|nr:zinc-dependent peptidase [Planctomycetales bacterium]